MIWERIEKSNHDNGCYNNSTNAQNNARFLQTECEMLFRYFCAFYYELKF